MNSRHLSGGRKRGPPPADTGDLFLGAQDSRASLELQQIFECLDGSPGLLIVDHLTVNLDQNTRKLCL